VAISEGAAVPADGPPTGLTPRQTGVLDFEQLLWHRQASKDNEIRVRLGMSPASYYVELSRIIETDAAMAYAPLLVQRLRSRIALAGSWGHAS